MLFRTAGVITALTIFAGGCASPIPVAENFEQSTQKVTRTAHHWDVVADDVIAQTAASIQKISALQTRPIYVVPGDTGSAFDKAFRNFLVTRLVDKGASVNVCPKDPETKTGFSVPPGPSAVEVNYETQVIVHKGRMPHYAPGALTWLVGDIGAIYNITESPKLHSAGFTNTAGVGLLLANDIALGHVAAPTHTELIVTTTITENNKYLMRKNDVYYIPDADAKLFSQRVSQKSLCSTERNNSIAVANPESQVSDLQAFVSARMARANPTWRSEADSE